jgi:hypothetical protein
MNSIMEGWIQACRRELLDRILTKLRPSCTIQSRRVVRGGAHDPPAAARVLDDREDVHARRSILPPSPGAGQPTRQPREPHDHRVDLTG